jgi:hypothetical protein
MRSVTKSSFVFNSQLRGFRTKPCRMVEPDVRARGELETHTGEDVNRIRRIE